MCVWWGFFCICFCFFPSWEKKKGNENIFAKTSHAKVSLGTDLPGQREASVCALVTEMPNCMTDPSMESEDGSTTTAQLQ